jgi:hypothetical protein
MSFALTTDQILNHTKTVTRRVGWQFLKPGEEINAVNKVMGFKKGERPVLLAKLRVISIRRERIDAITDADVIAEGFGLHPAIKGFPSCFVDFFCRTHRCLPHTEITRIEFEYL